MTTKPYRPTKDEALLILAYVTLAVVRQMARDVRNIYRWAHRR